MSSLDKILNLEVDVWLGKESGERAIDNRIRRLELDIRSKKYALERLKEITGRGSGGLKEIPEPLYIFADKYREEVPRELRRILLEWSDTPEELGALLHCVETEPGPLGELLGVPGPVHVVTTRRGVGEGDSRLPGLRLRAHLPILHRHNTFEWEVPWIRAGFFLFVPVGTHLGLNPRMNTTPFNAGKLAEALGLSESKARLEDSLVLVVPAQEGSLRTLWISKSRFRPLSGAYSWQCRVNATPRALDLAGDSRSMAVALQVELRKTIDMAAERAEQTTRVAMRVAADGLRRDLLRLEAEVKERRGRIDGLNGQLDVLGKGLKEVEAKLRNLPGRFQELAAWSERLVPPVKAAESLLQDLQREQAVIKKLAADTAALMARMKGDGKR